MAHDINEVLREVCQLSAEAVATYVASAGVPIKQMPELFMPAYVFQKMGPSITMALEVSAKLLDEWNTDARRRRTQMAPDATLELAVKELSVSARIDLVLFDGGGASKDEEDLLALVEFKRWNYGEDRRKLLTILEHVDTCPFGALCFLAEGAPMDSGPMSFRRTAELLGDNFCVHPVPLPEGQRKHSVLAQWFGRHDVRTT